MAHNEEPDPLDVSPPDAGSHEVPGGVAEIVERVFGEPPAPTLTHRQVRQRIEAILAARELQCREIAISDVPVARNALADASGRRVQFPEAAAYDRCFVALVDPQPNALWAHPAWWAFVPADGSGPVRLCDTRLPEHPRGAVRLIPVA